MKTYRFNPPKDWLKDKSNNLFIGLCDMILYLNSFFDGRNDLTMIEIGSAMGESASLFSSSGMFKEINCIDPFDKNSDGLSVHGYEWSFIKKQFDVNTRLFDNIKLYKDFSEDISDSFRDKSFDFLYLDGNHGHNAVMKDITLYKPKLKDYSIIGGHDFDSDGVRETVKDLLGQPDKIFSDFSWIKKIKSEV